MLWLSSVADSLVRQQKRGLRKRWSGDDAPSNGAAQALPDPEWDNQEVEPSVRPQRRLKASPRDQQLTAIFEAFDASQPVREQRGLYGRDEQLLRLMNGILYRRNHGVISGPRGSGKTSMVKVFGEAAEDEGLVVLYSANDADAAFGLMMRQLLERVPASSLAPGKDEAFQAKVQELDSSSGAQQVISLLAELVYSAVLIIIDEFDRAPDEAFKAHVSSLLKLSSDARLKVRFLLVGDERTFSEVVRGHASLGRHTTHVSTSPLTERAVTELLDGCADAVGLKFSDLGRKVIVNAVCGSPYHARLFGLHAALRAHSNGSQLIRISDAVGGLSDAFNEWASLNPEDAELFEQLVDGSDADLPLIEVALKLAWRKLPEAGDGDEDASGQLQEAIEKLRPAIDEAGGGISFKDATAAQFLIALHVIRSPSAREFVKAAKERADS